MDVALSSDDVIVYNEFPVKITRNSFDEDDCITYMDLPKLMDDAEKAIISALKFKKPTLEQAVEDFKCGCKEAFNFLYNHYKKKFGYVAAKYNNEDLVQELAMVLLHCIDKYEAGGSSCFNTLLWTAAQNHVGMIQIRNNSKKRKNEQGEISLNSMMQDMDVTVENVIEDKKFEDTMDDVLFKSILKSNILPKLDSEEKVIVNMTVDGYSVKEISEKTGISPSNIYMRFKKMREKEGLSEILKSLYYKKHYERKSA